MLKFNDLVRISLRQHFRQRSLSVILAISFGICVALVVLIIGRDIETRIVQDVNLIGNVSMIQLIFENQGAPGTPPRYFHDDTLAALRSDPRIVALATGMHDRAWFPITVGSQTVSIGAKGVDAWFWKTNMLATVEGRFFGTEDVLRRTRVCVLGSDTAQLLFGDGPYVGKILTMLGDNYEVIGVAKGAMIRSSTRTCYIPLTTAMDRGFRGALPNHVMLQVGRLDDVVPVVKELPGIIAAYQPSENLGIDYARDDVGKIRTITRWVRVLLVLAVGASLILGVLGIWQGAFTAVRDRTREIGLKLAMGAERADILAQFLAESLLKSIVGGLLGVVLGTVCILLGVRFLQIHLDWLELARLGTFSMLAAAIVGMAGGFYPAYCASRMDVVQALRYE
jgi:putative ABC transport system permease protein